MKFSSPIIGLEHDCNADLFKLSSGRTRTNHIRFNDRKQRSYIRMSITELRDTFASQIFSEHMEPLLAIKQLLTANVQLIIDIA